eukprot:jgi/Mesen1/2526/ME000161S01579
MATLVWTSDEEPTLAIARFMAETAWSEAGEEVAGPHVQQICGEAESLLAANRVSDLVNLLLLSVDTVLSKAADKDCECVFAVICNLVSKSQEAGGTEVMANEVAKKLTSKPTDKPALRLKLLFGLYNILKSPSSRFQLYMEALRFATAGKVADLIIPSFKRLDAFIKEWNLKTSDVRLLYLQVTNILKDHKGSARESYNYLLKYLGTFSESDAAQVGGAKHDAARAAVEFIKSPDLFQCDLLELAAVQQLEGDAQYGALHALLAILLTQRLDAYLAFQAQHAAALETWGIVHKECTTKMRLLSLASLATEDNDGASSSSSSSSSREIRYSVIRDTLQVGEDEVELWIVKAIAAKLVEAKMDQMRQLVHISRCTQRVFGSIQWRDLRSRLADWKDNVASISKIVQHSRASGGVIPQVAAAAY